MTPLTETEAAVVARFEAAPPAPESWGGDDTLRGLLSNEIRRRWVLRGDANADRFADALLPVVTAYAEQRARERAAEELRAAADACCRPDEAALSDRADALAADDRTGQR